MPFDPDHEWREGDVIPGQVLREAQDSRAEIRVHGQGRWADGYWDVTLARALDTGHPLEDKVLRDQGVYTVALSVHRDARASRWHYVSLPLQVGLARQADLVATRFNGNAPDCATVETRDITLLYPGQERTATGATRNRRSRRLSATDVANPAAYYKTLK